MPILMPYEDNLFRQEIELFNRLYREGLEEAVARFEDRAPYYDVDRPIWLRVTFPEGFINEIVDKGTRLQNALQNHQVGKLTEEQMWEKMVDEVPDIINYAAYLRSIIFIMAMQRRALGHGEANEARDLYEDLSEYDMREPDLTEGGA